MVLPRRWNIVLHEHGDSSFTARVWVGGKLLRPDCLACARDAALRYIADALIDARSEDRLTLRAQGHGGIRTFETCDPSPAMRWLADQIHLNV